MFGESLTEHFRGRSDKLFHRSVTMVPDETGPGSTGASHSFTIQAGASGEFLIEQMVQEFGALANLWLASLPNAFAKLMRQWLN